MKFVTTGIITAVAALAFTGAALAVGPGKTVEYAGGNLGAVTFSGEAHKGMGCNECHPNLFAMSRGAKITMADHNAGNLCFSCHKKDGTASATCADCHKK